MPGPDIASVRGTLVIGAEKKNQNYGIHVTVSSPTGALVVQKLNALNGKRAEGPGREFLLFDLPAQTQVQLDFGLHVSVISEHNAGGGQTEGIWEGHIRLDFTMSSGPPKNYSSPYFKMDHHGTLWGGDKTATYKFDVPPIP